MYYRLVTTSLESVNLLEKNTCRPYNVYDKFGLFFTRKPVMKKNLSFVKKDRHLSLALAIIVALLVSTNAHAIAGSPNLNFGINQPRVLSGNSITTFSKLDFVPNIETIGVVVSGVSLPKKADLMYRQSSDTVWHPGHPLMRIDDGRLVGSLFGLSPATSYDIKVLDGSTEISGSITTQPDELQFTPSVILHVNDDAPPGGDGSVTAPFRSIRDAVNRAIPGTQVLVADGIYYETVTFLTSGSEGKWIQVKAEGGGAILDGSKTLSGNIWQADASRPRVWSTKIGNSISYLARDQMRFYKYDDLSGLWMGLGHNKVPMAEGWYFNPATSTLYLRSLDNPSRHTWQVPRLNDGFDTSGYDWLWVEGFEVRHYGAQYGGCGICMQNASHVVIRKNKIHNMQLGIFINWTGGENRSNDTRIEFNQIYDPPVNEWPWSAVKGSSMEGTGIVVRGHIGAIVRNNEVHHFFNGIYTGSSGALENSALAFDADIYNNRIHHISDDGLEPEGACINQRFRENTVDTAYVGISLAPITQGPTWVLRSLFTNFTGRAIKWDGNSDGIVLIYHNTSWTNAKDVNGMDLINPVRNAVMRNNIFQVNGYGFQEVRAGSTGNDWNNDNWYTTRALTNGHFKWENVLYNTTTKLCKATGLECNGYEDFPGLVNPSGGDFTLLLSSPNIDRGIAIPGINSVFTGNAPDVGAYESTFVFDTAPMVLSSVRVDANSTDAASVNFTVTFSEPVIGVDTVPPFNDFELITSSSITGASITGVIPVSGTIYTISVKTGSGNGTIRLDLVDNDSIVDAANNPLGGSGAGNGNFNAGEVYTINKSHIDSVSEIFRSIRTYDGWVLESNENSNQGGSMNTAATIFHLGDDAKDRQFRGILSFNTGSIPDNAIVTSAQVKIKRQGLTGIDPFTTHGDLLLDISAGAFGNNIELKLDDFSAPVAPGSIQEKFSGLTYSWYAANLSSANLGFVNKYGATQFRLRFSRDDNDDLHADYMKFFSGNASDSDQPQLIITYSTGSGAVNSDKQSISTMSAVNESPLITSNGGLATASVNVTENTTTVTTVTASDADLPTQPLAYSISGGADSALFSINSSTGELIFIAAADFEVPTDAGSDHVYNVTVQASDGELTTSQDIAVTVTALNDNSPVITSNGALSIAENTTTVITVTAIDADLPTQPLTYSISGGIDSALFSINPSTGELAFIAAPDFEVPTDAGSDNLYNVIVQASDGELTATQDIAITITAINDNTPVITSNGVFSIAENTTAVTTVTATDVDLPAQALTYSISSGPDSALFSINPSTGELTFVTAPDYEVPKDASVDNIYNVAVQASDGTLMATQDIVVTVTPVNDNSPVVTSNGNLSIAENTTVVTTVTATDADLPAQPLTYSIVGGVDPALFTINSSTGELAFAAAPDFEVPMDVGIDNAYDLTVQASDGAFIAIQDIIITVTAVNDNNPVITSNGSLSIAENAVVVTTVTATDADLPAQPLTYSIIGGVDSALFSINSSTGGLVFLAAPDFEVPKDAGLDNVYNITVQASDGAFIATQDILIAITALNDNNPVITSSGSLLVAENVTAVTTVTATDADLPAQTLMYSIIGGADLALFSINSSTGELIFVTAPDFEVPKDSGIDNIYNVTVRASDGTFAAAQEVLVAVTAVNDNSPVIASNGSLLVAENLTAVTTVTATDADLPAQPLTYSIIGGADSALFSIDSSTGELTFVIAPDYEVPKDAGLDHIYNVIVQASDGTLTAVQNIVITNILIDTSPGPAVLPIHNFTTFEVIGNIGCSDIASHAWYTEPCNSESGGCWISTTPLFGQAHAGFQSYEGNKFCELNLP
jgi:hypothetical protein